MRPQFTFGMLILFAGAIFSSVGNAYDPWYGGGGFYGAGGGYGPGGYGGYGMYGGGYGGVGSVYSGMGNMMRAEGARNEMNSQAAINYQKAEIERQKVISAQIDNAKKLREQRDQLKRKTAAKDAANREADQEAEARRQKFEAEHRPLPLSPSELDPLTGKIQWPSTLQSFDFNETRTALDALFKTQAESGPSADLSAQVKVKVNKLKDELRARIQQIPLPEVTVSRKFLDRLAASVAPTY